MKTRTVLYADEGKVLTNGETYGKVIYPADGENQDTYYEISEEDYHRVMAAKEAVGV